MLIEKNFPRGGRPTKPNIKPEKSKTKINFGAVQKKVVKRKLEKDKLPEVSHSHNSEKDEIKAFSAAVLNQGTIQDGMNIMGMVMSVSDLYLTVSLPGSMVATVSALEISESYTKISKNYLDNSNANTDQYKPLSELYQVNQIIYGQVIETDGNNTARNSMSLKPKIVHHDLLHKNIEKGFIFNGAIEEINENGYIIESGIKGLRTFLPLEDNLREYFVGELIYLKVKKITHDKSVSTCICKAISINKIKLKDQDDMQIDFLLPSTIVQFNVNKKLFDGLQGTIMNENYTAYVNENHLKDPLALPKDYDVNETYWARILYIMPLTKHVYLTLNLDSPKKDISENSDTPKIKHGDIIKNARVHHIGAAGIIFVLQKQFKAFVSYNSIKSNYKGNYDKDTMLLKFASNTKHVLRVLQYHPMDSMYTCSNDSKAINEKYFSLDDIQPGQFVTAEINNVFPQINGYSLKVGKLKGIMEKIFMSPQTNHLHQTKLKCRVISTNAELKVICLTNRLEYMSEKCKILTSFADAKENNVYMGTIVKCTDSFYIVKFFNDISGLLFKSQLNGLGDFEINNFCVGQTMEFKIFKKDNEKISLSLNQSPFPFGTIVPVTVTHSLDSGLEIKTEAESNDSENSDIEVNGLVPLPFLSDFVELRKAKLQIYPLNSKITAVSIAKNIFSLKDVDYFKKNPLRNYDDIEMGDILRAHVKNVENDIIDVILPIKKYNKIVKIHSQMLVVGAFMNSTVILTPEQVIFVKVIDKQRLTQTLTVSGKLNDVWDGNFKTTAEYVQRYLEEVSEIKKASKKAKNPIYKYKIGDKVTAVFKGVCGVSQNWLFELKKRQIEVVVKSSIVGNTEPPDVGDDTECVILWIDYSNNCLLASNKKTDVAHISNQTNLDPRYMGSTQVQAKVLLKLENVFICSMKKKDNPLVFCPIRLHENDFERSASNSIKEGDFCKLAFIHETEPIAVLQETWKLWHDILIKRNILNKKNLKRKATDDKLETHKNVPKTEDESIQDKLNNPNVKKPDNENKKSTANNNELPVKKAKVEPVKKVATAKTGKESNDDKIKKVKVKKTNDENENKSKKPKSNVKLPGIENFWDLDLNDLHSKKSQFLSDEEGESPVNLPTKKMSAAEKFKLQRQEEDRLRAIEEKYADPNQLPESIDQFDRLMLCDPNNSKNWINYMVFHLQSTEIDRARSVAERALKAISFRNIDDLLNIWVALLNLELRYGNKERFDETLNKALTFCDPLNVYLRTVEVLSNAKKTQELIEILNIILKKFKTDQSVWKAAANAYFEINMVDRAQQMLQKALTCLPERDHVNTIVIFANLNHKYNQNAMAQALLDQVVTSYPKRVDVWTQYVDMLIKDNLIDSARNVLERAVIQKIPLKKMRTVFKKFMEFEEKYGNSTNVEKVKIMAKEYVKNNTS